MNIVNHSDIDVTWRCYDAPAFQDQRLIAKGKLAPGERYSFEPHKVESGSYSVWLHDAGEKVLGIGDATASATVVLKGAEGAHQACCGRYPAESEGYQAG